VNSGSDRQYQQRRDQYLKGTEHAYVFRPESGLYEPKSAQTATQRHDVASGAHPNAPLFINPRTDWRPVLFTTFISGLFSIATIILLATYTLTTQHIFETSQVAAIGTIQAAWAAKESADIAADSLQLSQAAEITVRNTASEAVKPWSTIFYFENIGNTDARNVLIRFAYNISDHPEDVDYLKELREFRAHPNKLLNWMTKHDKEFEKSLRDAGRNEAANTYRDENAEIRSLQNPKEIVASIAHGTIIGRKLNLDLRGTVLILIDWDDVLPKHTHHTNDLCFLANPQTHNVDYCVSPAKQ
jgi:hypothetical protein